MEGHSLRAPVVPTRRPKWTPTWKHTTSHFRPC
jgi:hypothetical protein